MGRIAIDSSILELNVPNKFPASTDWRVARDRVIESQSSHDLGNVNVMVPSRLRNLASNSASSSSFPGSATSARYFPWRAREASTSQKNGSPPPPPPRLQRTPRHRHRNRHPRLCLGNLHLRLRLPARAMVHALSVRGRARGMSRGGARRRTTNVHQPHVVRQIIRRPVVVLLLLLLLGDPVRG